MWAEYVATIRTLIRVALSIFVFASCQVVTGIDDYHVDDWWGADSGPPDGGSADGTLCSHDPCTSTNPLDPFPLDPSCSPCVNSVCSRAPACCSDAWAGNCAQLAWFMCEVCGGEGSGGTSSIGPWETGGASGGGGSYGGGTGGDTCAHDVCTVGVPLDPACSACVRDVCDYSDYSYYCCSQQWDDVCVEGARYVCGMCW